MNNMRNTANQSNTDLAVSIQFNQSVAIQNSAVTVPDSPCSYQGAWDIWRLGNGPQGGIGGTGI